MSSKQSRDAQHAAKSVASETASPSQLSTSKRAGVALRRSESTAISTRLPAVAVEYEAADGTRVVKHFADAFAARRFYVRQDRLGHNPQVRKGQ